MPCWSRSLAFLLLLASSLSAQVERNAAERRIELESVSLFDGPLRRVLLSEAGLVLWVPASFRDTQEDPNFRIMQSDRPGAMLAVWWVPLEPGTSFEEYVVSEVADSERNDLGRIDSIRRTRIAGLPAVEVVGTWEDSEARACLMFWLDVEGGLADSLSLLSGPGSGEQADGVLEQILRDSTRIEGRWDEVFELVRELFPVPADPERWNRRNALFARIASPSGIDADWVQRELDVFADENLVFAWDGLLHPHPRVRTACLRALLARLRENGPPSSLPASLNLEITRLLLLRRGLEDEDPVVRFEAARHAREVGAEPMLAALLKSEHPRALDGLYQLLLVLDPELREAWLRARLAELEGRAGLVQRLLVHLLARQAPAPVELLRELEATAPEPARRAALEELLCLGDPGALEVARSCLADPEEPSRLVCQEAAKFWAVHAAPEELPALRAAITALERARETAEARRRPALRAARRSLVEVCRYLEALSADAPEAPQLSARLRSGDFAESWARLRLSRLSSATSPGPAPVPVIRVVSNQPGAELLRLADLLSRLSFPNPQLNLVLHQILERLGDSLELLPDRWVGRDRMSQGTGVDFGGPVRWCFWRREDPGLDLAQAGSSLSFTVEIPTTDRVQAAETLLRLASADRLDFAATGLPVLLVSVSLSPALLLGFWAIVQQNQQGESDERKAERFFWGRTIEEGSRFAFLGLKLWSRGMPTRPMAFLRLTDDRLVLASHDSHPVPIERPASRSGTHLQVDFGNAGGSSLVGSEAADRVLRGILLDAVVETGAEDVRLSFEFADRGFPELVSSKAAELRAPRELLPAGTLFWVGARVDPGALAARLEGEYERFLPLLEPLEGELGLALLALPDPRGAENGRSLEESFCLFARCAGPEMAERLTEVCGALRLTEHGPVFDDAAGILGVRGDYLVIGSAHGKLGGLREEAGASFADTAAYRALLEHAAPEGVLFGAFATEAVVANLLEFLGVEDEWMPLVARMFGVVGPLTVTAGREKDAIRGEFMIRPSLMDEQALQRVRRLVSRSRYMSGCVRGEGVPETLSAREVRSLAVEIPGLDEPPVLPRGEVTELGDGTWRIETEAGEPLPLSCSAALPPGDAQLDRWLRSERGLEVDHPELVALAREIRGEERDAARIVRAILAWVDENLEYRMVWNARSIETLASREADCSEYSQLVVALCRTIGIPAREVTGLSLASYGFVHHAWVEVYLDRWYEFDPTWSLDYVPAGHLRLDAGSRLILLNRVESEIRFRSAVLRDGTTVR